MAKILVVDDSITYRQMMTEVLEQGGHTVVGEAEDGLQAVKLFKELRPDITTLDITMPNMDGLTALKVIKELNSNAIVIVVSSSAQARKLAQAATYGASDFLPKPFESTKIISAIDRMLSAESLDTLDDDRISDALESLDLEFLE